MRVLVFLVISTLAHVLAARFVLAVFPSARARSRRIWWTVAALSMSLAVVRVLGVVFPHSDLLHDGLAVALIELTIILLSLPIIGALLLVTRAGFGVAAVVQPEPTEATKEERIGRRVAIERVAGLTTIGATTVTLGWGSLRGRHDFAVEEVVVKVRNWPRVLDGYVIAQVSDIHVGAFVRDRELDEGFDLVQRVRPDLIVATGDLVDNQAHAIGALLTRMIRVSARDGAFAILGNHDHYAGAAQVAALIESSPVKLLDNQHVRVRPNDGGGFALVGVDDLQGRRSSWEGPRGPDLGRALGGLPPEISRILLAHQPHYFIESQGRVDLQLSGHTHGGQINPGFNPAALLMEFVAGRYERAGSTLWVNRGFGVTGPPSRIRSAPEITKIVVVAG